jgi:hypothetical protein
MNQVGYEETGNVVPVKRSELIEYVHRKLDEYIELMNATQTKPSFDPFNESIIYTTKEGKMVKIQDEVQKQAIVTWSESRNRNGNNPNAPTEISGAGYEDNYGAPLLDTTHMGQFGNQMEKQIQDLEQKQGTLRQSNEHNNSGNQGVQGYSSQIGQPGQVDHQMVHQMPHQMPHQGHQNNNLTQEQYDSMKMQQQQIQQRQNYPDDEDYSAYQDQHNRNNQERLLVVEKDNAALYYAIIVLLMSIGGYYYYANKKKL